MTKFHLLVCHESQEVFIMSVETYEEDALKDLFIIQDTSENLSDLQIKGRSLAGTLNYNFNK